MGQDWAAACLDDGVPTLRCLPDVFHNVINAFLVFGGVVALFMIAWGAIGLIRSGGDPKQIAGARQTITWAIVGLIIVLCSFGIIYFIGYLTKSEDCIGTVDNILTGCK